MKRETHFTYFVTAIALTTASTVMADGHAPGSPAESATWSDRIAFFGSLDIDLKYLSPESGDRASDLIVSEAELGADFYVLDRLTASGSLLFEEDETDVEVDIATLTYAFGATGLSLTVGQDYVPFGNFSTYMISDPLTRQAGEFRETVLLVNFAQGPLDASVYVFNGEQDDDGLDRLASYGSRLAYHGNGFSVGIDYTSNIADSDRLQEGDYGLSTGEEQVSATSIYGEATLGPVGIIAEYVASDGGLAVDGNGSEPNLTNIEASYEFGDHLFAVSHQITEDSLFLDLPKERTSVAYSTMMHEGVEFGIELARDEDYSVADGGTGESTDSAIIRISLQYP